MYILYIARKKNKLVDKKGHDYSLIALKIDKPTNHQQQHQPTKDSNGLQIIIIVICHW